MIVLMSLEPKIFLTMNPLIQRQAVAPINFMGALQISQTGTNLGSVKTKNKKGLSSSNKDSNHPPKGATPSLSKTKNHTPKRKNEAPQMIHRATENVSWNKIYFITPSEDFLVSMKGASANLIRTRLAQLSPKDRFLAKKSVLPQKIIPLLIQNRLIRITKDPFYCK